MSKLNRAQKDYIIELLLKDQELPINFKHMLFPPDRQEYELVYANKEREEDVIAETMGVPLQPIRSFGQNGDWHNKLIFGDNLQAMKTLLQLKEQGKFINSDGSKGIKTIYIDPPFATKREFQGSQQEKAYQDKIAGAKFIEFIRKRLVIFHKLLANNGSIFVHLDQRKVHYIKAILDEVFGENNFRNEIILPGRASKNLQQQFKQISRLNVRHDTLLWYSKTSATRFSPLWIEKHNAGNPEGHWHHFWSTADRPTMRYELLGITPKTGQWTWKKTRALQAIDNYLRYIKEAGGRTLAEYWRDTGCNFDFVKESPKDGKPQYWRAPAKDRLADTLWAGIPIYSSKTKYPTEKNEALLAQILDLSTEKDDLVLDAFSGSGTSLAVSEKLGRKWIGIDSSKLSIYTIQKRMLNLKSLIGNQGSYLPPKPFTLYNAGLYDFSRLRTLPWPDWRFFALNLFQCQDNPHKLGGIQLDGFKSGDDVLVFNHTEGEGVVLDYGFIDDLHSQIGSKTSSQFYIIAPAASVVFLEDYIDLNKTRYYILRIPYSIINELHTKDFEALLQPIDATQVNETVEAVGFDFIQTPKVACNYFLAKGKGRLFDNAVVKIKKFKSIAMAKGVSLKGNRETLSMVLIDYDYPYNSDRKGDESPPPFEFDDVFLAKDIESNDWEIRMLKESIKDYIMLVYVDIYGNEYTEIKTLAEFKKPRKKRVAKKPAVKKDAAKGQLNNA
jgi:hypothetical protein